MPDGQDDSQLRIGAYIDPSGADAGSKQVVADVDKIGESTGKAAQGGQKLVENLGSLRNAHHALAAISEIAAGGTEAIAGEAMGVRFLAEAFESLIPGGALLIAITTVLSLGASMIARQQEHNEKLEDGKHKTDDLKDSVDSLKTSEEDESKAADAAMQSFADKVKAEDEAFKDAQGQNKDRMDALQKEVDLRKQLVDAVLDGARAIALQQNTGGAGGALAIEEKFNALKGTTDTNAKFQKLNLDLSDAFIQQQATGDQDRQIQGNRDTSQKQLDDLTATRDRAVTNAREFGIPQDHDGGFKGAADGAREGVAALLQQWKGLQTRITDFKTVLDDPLHGPSSGMEKAQLAQMQQQAADTDAQLKEMLLRERLAANADKAVKAYDDKESGAPGIQKQIDEANKQLAGFHEDLKKGDEKITQLQYELKIARQDKSNDAVKAAGENKGKEQALSDKDFEGQNKAAITTQQIIAEDKTKPAADREKAFQAIADLKNALLQHKIDEATAIGADKLTSGEIADLRAQMGQNTQEAKDRAGEIGKEATHTTTTADKAQTEALKKRVEELEKQIREMTNNPEILRSSQAIMTAFDANPMSALAQMQNDLALAVKAGFADVYKKIDSTKRISDSLRNSQGSSN